MPIQSAIRPGNTRDLPAVTDIYAHYVRDSVATFEIEPPDLDEMRRRFETTQNSRCPFLVAERGGAILGYAYAARYRSRPAYRLTVENSVYIATAATHNGIGTQLLARLIRDCRDRGFKQIIAVIGGGAENVASVRLHLRCDFHHIGVLTGVGRKFDRWVDTLLMQRAL